MAAFCGAAAAAGACNCGAGGGCSLEARRRCWIDDIRVLGQAAHSDRPVARSADDNKNPAAPAGKARVAKVRHLESVGGISRRLANRARPLSRGRGRIGLFGDDLDLCERSGRQAKQADQLSVAVRDGKDRLEPRGYTFRRHCVERFSCIVIRERSFRVHGAASLCLA